MNNKHVGASRLYITFNKGIPTTKLVVRGISTRADAQELEREFARSDNILIIQTQFPCVPMYYITRFSKSLWI